MEFNELKVGMEVGIVKTDDVFGTLRKELQLSDWKGKISKFWSAEGRIFLTLRVGEDEAFVTDNPGRDLYPLSFAKSGVLPSKNSFKVGDRVEVVVSDDRDIIPKGTHGIVIRCDSDSPMVNFKNGTTTYTVEKEKCKLVPEPSYRPYSDEELKDLVGEVLTAKADGHRVLVTEQIKWAHSLWIGSFACNGKELLDKYYRNGNQPCGMKEEV